MNQINNNNNVGRALNVMERQIMAVGRLIEIEEYQRALSKIVSLKRNLSRLRNGMVDIENFETLNNCLDDLKRMCLETPQLEATENLQGYSAPVIHTRARGRPKLAISREQLQIFIEQNYTAKQMAKHFNCSVQLVYKKCYSFGLTLRQKYYRGTDQELTNEIQMLHNEFPNSGSQMMAGYLRSRGIFTQRNKIRRILSNIDPVGTACRWSAGIQRRTYHVPTPNSLWHIDANLKLIRWNFAIHGCIDGYSRLILYLKCTTSMTAETIVPFFTSAVEDYGLPSRVRSDFGYENIQVAMIMNALRGLNRGSHITGRSVHNQRIERLWVDVYAQVIDFYHKEFYNMEESGLLDINNSVHMFALQKVYASSIDKKLQIFLNAWNLHTIRTTGRSPKQLWLSGMLQNLHSNYTAAQEIFQAENLYTRIVGAFGAEGLVYAVEENLSELTVQFPVNEETANQITQIVTTEQIDRIKFLRIVECLTGN